MSIARYEHSSYFGPMYEHSSSMIIFLSCMSNVYHSHFHDPYKSYQPGESILRHDLPIGIPCHSGMDHLKIKGENFEQLNRSFVGSH